MRRLLQASTVTEGRGLRVITGLQAVVEPSVSLSRLAVW